MDFKFYMQQCTKNGVLIEGTKKDLEADFNGLRYSSMDGIEKLGAIKNIYEEEYADADKLRVYMPDKVEREATTIVLTLYFIGADRAKTFDAFNEYIMGKFLRYWDTARNKAFIFYVKEEINILDDFWYGSKAYLKCSYTLNNIYGCTFDVDAP